MTQLMKQFWHDEEGVTAIEYGLIAALIAIVLVVGLTAAGTNLNLLFSRIAACVAAPTAANC
jgi:pilus assembly protein Flp/PilA